ncbi:MAG: hypothetical protein ACO3XO_09840, partial [Bdellovibrionota bacterium]
MQFEDFGDTRKARQLRELCKSRAEGPNESISINNLLANCVTSGAIRKLSGAEIAKPLSVFPEHDLEPKQTQSEILAYARERYGCNTLYDLYHAIEDRKLLPSQVKLLIEDTSGFDSNPFVYAVHLGYPEIANHCTTQPGSLGASFQLVARWIEKGIAEEKIYGRKNPSG